MACDRRSRDRDRRGLRATERERLARLLLERQEVQAHGGPQHEHVPFAAEDVAGGLSKAAEHGSQAVAPSRRRDLGPERLDRLLGQDPPAADRHKLEQLGRLSRADRHRPPAAGELEAAKHGERGRQRRHGECPRGRQSGLGGEGEQRLGQIALANQRNLRLALSRRLLERPRGEHAGLRVTPPQRSVCREQRDPPMFPRGNAVPVRDRKALSGSDRVAVAREQRALGHRDQPLGVLRIALGALEVVPGERRLADAVQAVRRVGEEVSRCHLPPVAAVGLDTAGRGAR